MAELTEKEAEAYIRRSLKEKDWSKDDTERIISFLMLLDGFWSYGTNRAVKDLEQIYEEMEADDIAEERAERYIRRALRGQDWTIGTVDIIVDAVDALDGFRSTGTVKTIHDLAKIYAGMAAKHGDPPDREW